VLADLFESLIAYLRLQFGLEVSRIFIIELLYPYRDDAEALRGKSYKSLLQELIQKHYQTLPVYVEEEVEVESSGNVLSYRSTVMLGEKVLGTGLAQNKRKAQEEAAEQAYTSLATAN
jgi:ribonuclease-3